MHYRRLALGLTLGDVAERAAMTAAALARIEPGAGADVAERLRAVLTNRVPLGGVGGLLGATAT